ncbi:MAG: cob(I)yrinic acid a,c-diamide adenosyltransferase [bacterium]|nr:cob(I)yrinic acid a,c-diamide adenosyltransferase [bacterium]
MSAEKRVLLFTGEGKGKTTAALGMALRAWGHGMRVACVFFVKSRHDVGEVLAMQKLDGWDHFVTGLGFLPAKDHPDFIKHVEAARAGLEKSRELVRSGDYDMIVLDEVCWAAHRGLLDPEAIAEVVGEMRADSSLVLTGRFADDRLLALADTASSMKFLKHGYDDGIPAQAGIEK